VNRREKPTTSAALPTEVSRSTARARFFESARILAQRLPLFAPTFAPLVPPRVPVLVRHEVLFPEQHVDVSAAELYRLFHRPETMERFPLVLVVAPVPDDAMGATARRNNPPFMGTLARVRTDGDDDDAPVRLQGIHRVALDALPAAPRALVRARARPLTHTPNDEPALRARLVGPFRAYLVGPIGIDPSQVDLIVNLPTEFLAYFIARVAQLELKDADFVLRIDSAAELVDVAAEMAEAALDTNSTG
jgi:hypothetical protein